ncbi:MAG: MFS transporter, partial [Bifidobacteriaceae bacterium]|nr:MFS transporter [Bifidobacteriaceae bacterium]
MGKPLAKLRVEAGGERWVVPVGMFLGGQAISLFGSALVQYAVIWWVVLETDSATYYTLATVAALLPAALFSVFGGVWADRYNRKALIIGADAGVAVVTAILAAIVLLGESNLWIVFGALALRGIGNGIQTPAVTAMIPQVTPTDQLMRVNAIAGVIHAAVLLVAPAVAAGLLATIDLGWIFAIDVVTAGTAIAAIGLIHVPRLASGQSEDGKRHAGREMQAGLRYAWKDKVVRRVLVGYAAMFLLVVPAANLVPIAVTRMFGASLLGLSAIEIVWSAGTIIGGAILAAWGGMRNRMAMMLIVAGMWGVFTIGLGVSPNIWVFLVIMAIFGMSLPGLTTTATTALQERVAPDYQGRVFGLVNIVMTLSSPLGMAVAGPLADVFSIRSVLVVTGILTIAAAIVLSIGAPRIEPPPKPQNPNPDPPGTPR